MENSFAQGLEIPLLLVPNWDEAESVIRFDADIVARKIVITRRHLARMIVTFALLTGGEDFLTLDQELL